jgi:hypothetical protein
MADDDWRVTVTLHDARHTGRAVRLLGEHAVGDDVRRRLGGRVAVSSDGPRLFLYAGAEDAARAAERVAREALDRHGLVADVALQRWSPADEDWTSPGAPIPDEAEVRQAEHQRLMEAETRQSLAHGEPGWEVRVAMPSRHAAAELADWLRAGGQPVIRRWRYVLVGAANQDEADELARRIEGEVPAASVRTGMASFSHYGLSPAGHSPFMPVED